jgi:hypothetical protein
MIKERGERNNYVKAPESRDWTWQGGPKEKSSILADQLRPRIWAQTRGSGGGGGLANEYSCAHGAQLNFGDLTPYLTHRCDLYPLLLFLCMNSYIFSRVGSGSGSGSGSAEGPLVAQIMGQVRSFWCLRHKGIYPGAWEGAKQLLNKLAAFALVKNHFPPTLCFCLSSIRQTTCI